MRTSRPLLLLCATVAVLAGVAAGIGVFADQVLAVQRVGPVIFTNVYGEQVELYGVGIYEHDSVLRGSGQRGVDLVTLFLAVPLLAVSAWLSRRGSRRGTLTLTGALCWFAYVGLSYLGAVAYNELFLVYVALASTSLFALALSFAAVDRDDLATHLDDRIPRRGPAVLLIACGVVTLGIWLVSPLTGLMLGQPPSELESHTTLFTHGLDIAVIVPLTILAGVLILRRDPRGYVLGIPLIVFAALLAPMVISMTVVQLRAGVVFTPGQVVGPICGFVVLAVIATWMLAALLRHVGHTPPRPLRTPSTRARARLR